MKTFNDPFVEIKKEVIKYSVDTINEFMKLFPCDRKNYFIPVPENVKKHNIKIMVKGAQLGSVSAVNGQFFHATWNTKYLHLPPKPSTYVICGDAKDFWERWNRFKKLRTFL